RRDAPRPLHRRRAHGIRVRDRPARPAPALLDARLRFLPHGPGPLRGPSGPRGGPGLPRLRRRVALRPEGARPGRHGRLVRRPPPSAGSLDAMEASAVSRLNAVIHERARLGIMSVLAARNALTFGELKALLD